MAAFEFLYDFGSLNAYLAHKAVPAMEQRTGVSCSYVPILLGGVFKLTGNRSPVEQFQGIRNKNEYQWVEIQRFLARHGITGFRMNPAFPVNTIQIMRGAIVAQEEGVERAYVDAMFAAMWEQEKKLDEEDVARAAIDAAGLDGAHILARTREQAVKDRLIANTNDAVERGVFGSPTFFAGGEMYFGKDRLREVEEALAGTGPA